MKFEKRSGDEAETPSSAPEETPSTGKKPVVIYIMILFIVAFLLMALSFLMHQRSNSEVLGELQDSVTAMQEVQATQDALLDLQNQLDEAQTTIDALESSAEETDAALAETQRENQALLALYTIQQQYSAGDLAGCQASIDAFEAVSYTHLLTASASASLAGSFLAWPISMPICLLSVFRLERTWTPSAGPPLRRRISSAPTETHSASRSAC